MTRNLVVGYSGESHSSWSDQPEHSSILLFNLGYLLPSLPEAGLRLHINRSEAIGIYTLQGSASW